MGARFLSAGSDSKLVIASDYLEPSSNPHFLGFRLHVLLGILFGRTIVTTEGWALDSLTLIRILSELSRAMNQVRNRNRPAGFSSFHPIIMESKRDGSYSEILAAYAARQHEVRWSGFKPAIDANGAREHLDRRMQECCISSVDMPSHIRDTFGAILDQADLADDIGDVATYFLSRSAERQQRVYPKRDDFRLEYNRCIRNLHTNTMDSTGEAARLLNLASNNILNEGIYFGTSSQAMAHASDHPPEVEQGLMRLVNYAFLHTAAESLGSALSTPPFPTEEETLEGQVSSLIEQTIVKSHITGQSAYSNIQVNAQLDLTAPIGHHLYSLHDWQPIWEQVIRLALSQEWLDARNKVIRRIAEGEKPERVLDEPDGRKLLSLLEEWVPQLVLRRSAAERCGIAIKLPEGWKKAFDSGMKSGSEETAKSLINAVAPIGVGAIAPEIVEAGFFAELSLLPQWLVAFTAGTSTALLMSAKANPF